MNTYDLIQAALTAQSDFDAARAAASSAAANLQKAQTALDAANQALHDDLAANGPAVLIDDTTDPATITLYTAQEPNSWNSNVIRVAA